MKNTGSVEWSLDTKVPPFFVISLVYTEYKLKLQ